MSIDSDLTRIENAKAAIKARLQAIGKSVGNNDTIDTFAGKIPTKYEIFELYSILGNDFPVVYFYGGQGIIQDESAQFFSNPPDQIWIWEHKSDYVAGRQQDYIWYIGDDHWTNDYEDFPESTVLAFLSNYDFVNVVWDYDKSRQTLDTIIGEVEGDATSIYIHCQKMLVLLEGFFNYKVVIGYDFY